MNDPQKDEKMVFAAPVPCLAVFWEAATAPPTWVWSLKHPLVPSKNTFKNSQHETMWKPSWTAVFKKTTEKKLGYESTRKNHDTGSADLHFLRLICFIQSVMITQLKNWIYWMLLNERNYNCFRPALLDDCPMAWIQCFPRCSNMCRGQQMHLVNMDAY